MCFYVTIFQVYVSRNQKKLLPPLLPGKMYSPSKQLAYSIMGFFLFLFFFCYLLLLLLKSFLKYLVPNISLYESTAVQANLFNFRNMRWKIQRCIKGHAFKAASLLTALFCQNESRCVNCKSENRGCQ